MNVFSATMQQEIKDVIAQQDQDILTINDYLPASHHTTKDRGQEENFGYL
jgi:hypothetical protein